MKKLLPLLLCLMLLGGCSAPDPLQQAASPAGDVHIPAAGADASLPQGEETATLWFRFGTEPLLAPETRSLRRSPTAPWEFTLLEALIGGPAAASTELRGLFPPGTQVLSTQRHERRLFVTLSHQIMNAYADEPDNWAASEAWREEAPLRRILAMQAIAATVTESCDVDEVVILVEQKQITNSLRLRQAYYLTGDDAAILAEPLTRDESLLLTHRRCMEIILQCWSERNWLRLHRYVAASDPATGQQRPGEASFAAEMETLPHLISFDLSGGSVSGNGQQAVFTLEGRCMASGREYDLHSAVIRLLREQGQWRIPLSQLTGREVGE